MSRETEWRTVAAQTLYHGYPDSDLLPIEPPGSGQPIDAFKHQAEAAGDTLFLFLCREAADDIDALEYLNRLDRAVRDIEAVHAAVTEQIVDRAWHLPAPDDSHR
ncbi:MAG: hypothetical protein ACE5EQ_07925 [Phycisphaerae bacterium]